MERPRIQKLHWIVRNEHDLPHADAPCVPKAPAKAEAKICYAQHARLKRTTIEPIGIERCRRMWFHPRQEHQERNYGHEPHNQLIGKMHHCIRDVSNRTKRQELVQAELRETTDDRAKDGSQNHRDFHVALNRTLFRRHAFVRRKKNEIYHLEADGKKSTNAGQFQKQGNHPHMSFFRRLNRHHFADEAVEEGNACNRERADDETDKHKRIPLRHTAELIDLSNPGSVCDCITTHEE